MKKIEWKWYLPGGAWVGVGALVVRIGAFSVANGGCPFAAAGGSPTVMKAESNREAAAAAPAKEVGEMSWMTDFKAAKALAEKEKKDLLISFSGSDWCGWCIKLDQEVMEQPEFLEWAKKNVVLLKLDFPQNIPQSEALKRQNETLAQYYGVQGFPTVILAKPDGQVIARTGYQRGGAAAYVKHLDELLKQK